MPPHYLARETNERTGGGGAKKLGVGLKKRTAAMKQSESPSSYDDDSDSLPSVQPRKKSRGTTVGRMSGTSPPQVMIQIRHKIQGQESTQ